MGNMLSMVPIKFLKGPEWGVYREFCSADVHLRFSILDCLVEVETFLVYRVPRGLKIKTNESRAILMISEWTVIVPIKFHVCC